MRSRIDSMVSSLNPRLDKNRATRPGDPVPLNLASTRTSARLNSSWSTSDINASITSLGTPRLSSLSRNAWSPIARLPSFRSMAFRAYRRSSRRRWFVRNMTVSSTVLGSKLQSSRARTSKIVKSWRFNIRSALNSAECSMGSRFMVDSYSFPLIIREDLPAKNELGKR